MAQVTTTVSQFGNGQVNVQLDWNDANGSIIRGRVINTSAYPAKLYVLLNPPINGFSRVDVDAAAGQTIENNLPNNTVKFTSVLEDGVSTWKLLGVEIHGQWPSA